MRRQKRDPVSAEAEIEHRRREDAAPRLCEAVTRLQSLRLRFEDVRSDSGLSTPAYVRPIVVTTAPAHFEIRCLEPRCDGRHQLTQAVLHELRQGKTQFAGQSGCDGTVGDVSCNRILGYSCEATYRT